MNSLFLQRQFLNWNYTTSRTKTKNIQNIHRHNFNIHFFTSSIEGMDSCFLTAQGRRLVISIGYHKAQGWAQDLLGRDRDQDRDLSSRDRDETETFAKLSETRPRRDPRVSETRPRRDLFLVETISRHMAYICLVYALHTVSQKMNPL